MDLLVLAIQLIAVCLIAYGGVHCFWHQLLQFRPEAHERRRRRYRGRRNMRLIVELGAAREVELEETEQPEAAVAEPRKAA